MPRVRDVNEMDLPDVRAFLERHADTSMFLLSNLATNGPRVGASLTSGNFKLIEEDGKVRAVFCLTRRMAILAEAGGRAEFAEAIVDACRAEPIPIGGAIGEWALADAIWSILKKEPAFRQVLASKEKLQVLELSRFASSSLVPQVRNLNVDDFEQWEHLNAASSKEEGMPMSGTSGERRAMFQATADRRRWWGYFEEGRLVSMACLNAVYRHLGQVGGVYTASERRRSGLSRATLNTLLADSVSVHGLERMILFTGHQNHAAQSLYDSLGFSITGDFGLLICEPLG